MSTFISTFPEGSAERSGDGPTLAVKDLIDIAGTITTAGSLALASIQQPAAVDAPLMAGARAARAQIIGKSNLYELAFGASGVNPHYGTPVNPLNARLLPGGSSSGSAVAVASGICDLAYGSDTGGSIRVPAAFCGIAGLKTTFGRVDLTGVHPLAPSLDTVGPMARDIAGVVAAMALLEPGFAPSQIATSLALVATPGVAIDPRIARAVAEVCQLSGLLQGTVAIDSWMEAFDAGSTILHVEAYTSARNLYEDPQLRALLSEGVRDRLAIAATMFAREAPARDFGEGWRGEMSSLLERYDVLALPSVGFYPPPVSEAFLHVYTHLTTPWNLIGLPALSIPIPSSGPFPASLQLLGAAGSEEMLLATGAHIEALIASQGR